MDKTYMKKRETSFDRYERINREFMENKEKFLSTFKPSLNANDYVKSRDIKWWCEQKGIKLSYYYIKWMMAEVLHFKYRRSGYTNCIMDDDNIINLDDEDYYIDYCVDMKVDEMLDYVCSNLLMGTPY